VLIEIRNILPVISFGAHFSLDDKKENLILILQLQMQFLLQTKHFLYCTDKSVGVV
jgi:hypothetical protein